MPTGTATTLPTGATTTLPTALPRLSRSEPDNAPPAVGPQPFRLAATRYDEVWELSDDGSPLRRFAVDARDPSWAPDGGRLAYAYWPTATPDPVTSVRVLDVASMQWTTVAEDPHADFTDPAFSPDGTRLAVTRWPRSTATPPGQRPTVMVIDLGAPSGSNKRSVAEGYEPSWLSDDRVLHRCQAAWCISRLDSGNRVEVPNSGELLHAVSSPDGAWIAGVGESGYKVEVLRPDGTGRRTIGGNTAGHPPTWTPDGSRIVYPTVDGLRSIRLDGSDLRAHTSDFWEEPTTTARR